MKTSDYKLSSYGIHRRRLSVRGFILAFTAMVLLSGISIAVAALDENTTPEVGTNYRQIKWSADDAVWDLTESLLVLTGNVKIVQGKTVIIADRVRMFSIGNVAAKQTLNADSVEKFVANGNVRIQLEIGVATSEEAVYFAETKILTLSGTPAKFVMSDENTFQGSTITVNRETGIISIDDFEGLLFPEGDL